MKRARRAITVPRTRGRPKVVPDDVQRGIIIDEARELFIKQGYAGATMDKVAARCRISKRTLYRLFPSKTDLFTAVVVAHRQTMIGLPGNYDDLSLADALEKIFKIDIDMEADRERAAFVRFMVVESEKFPELDHLARRHGRDKSLSLLSEWLAHQKELGRMEIDCPLGTAKILMSMMFGPVIFKKRGEHDWQSQEERAIYIRRCIRIFLDGVRRR